MSDVGLGSSIALDALRFIARVAPPAATAQTIAAAVVHETEREFRAEYEANLHPRFSVGRERSVTPSTSSETQVARLLAVLKTIAEEPDGSWKTTLAWQAYKREVPDAQ